METARGTGFTLAELEVHFGATRRALGSHLRQERIRSWCTPSSLSEVQMSRTHTICLEVRERPVASRVRRLGSEASAHKLSATLVLGLLSGSRLLQLEFRRIATNAVVLKTTHRKREVRALEWRSSLCAMTFLSNQCRLSWRALQVRNEQMMKMTQASSARSVHLLEV